MPPLSPKKSQSVAALEHQPLNQRISQVEENDFSRKSTIKAVAIAHQQFNANERDDETMIPAQRNRGIGGSPPQSLTNGVRQTVLVTGGCGYIGSHTITCLLAKDYNVVVVDNLSNSSSASLDRVAQIAGLTDKQRLERLVFYPVDVCNEDELRKVFVRSPTFHACIHFAGLKAVGESTRIPLRYYENNMFGTFVLLRLMDEFGCHRLVFSSSATVYGAAETVPITEQDPVGVGITNAYGRTKHMIEEVLRDYHRSKEEPHGVTAWSITILRYFNPVGAHSSGLIGEDPNGIPNNLMPYVSQVAVGRRDHLTVFGGDYPTRDGTGVRDYLHVMDLADGHLAAIRYMKSNPGGLYTFNLGTGKGVSVLDLVKAMSKACGHEIRYRIGNRRPGDIAVCYADATKALAEMRWKATRDLDEICRDSWRWQSRNPKGYLDVENSENVNANEKAVKK